MFDGKIYRADWDWVSMTIFPGEDLQPTLSFRFYDSVREDRIEHVDPRNEIQKAVLWFQVRRIAFWFYWRAMDVFPGLLFEPGIVKSWSAEDLRKASDELKLVLFSDILEEDREKPTLYKLIFDLDCHRAGFTSRPSIEEEIDRLGLVPLHRRREEFQRKSADLIRFLIDRDGASCAHCGTTESLTVDHIHPISRGGSDDPENLQILCSSCNSSKGARVA